MEVIEDFDDNVKNLLRITSTWKTTIAAAVAYLLYSELVFETSKAHESCIPIRSLLV